MNRILPIGSVVMLEDGQVPLMIIGYMQQFGQQPDVFADYLGVPYPAGSVSLMSQLGFQMTDIDHVIFEGYKDESFEPYEKLLKFVEARHTEELAAAGELTAQDATVAQNEDQQ